MINWKYVFVVSAVCTTLFAQSKVENIEGSIILKDKDSKEFEIKKDSSFSVKIVPNVAIDKLVLGKNQYQITITMDKNEATYDVEQVHKSNEASVTDKSESKMEYRGTKESNNQSFHINCYGNKKIKNELAYEKVSVSCVKTNGCKAYTLGTDKKFKYGDASICTGKKDVELSKETPAPIYEETIFCKMYDETVKENLKRGIVFSFTQALPEYKEKVVKVGSTASDCK